jgi:hypothetical protein
MEDFSLDSCARAVSSDCDLMACPVHQLGPRADSIFEERDMPQAETLRTLRRRGLPLFKADHPRGIDRYIDYFGGQDSGAGFESSAAADRGRQALLEQFSTITQQRFVAAPA